MPGTKARKADVGRAMLQPPPQTFSGHWDVIRKVLIVLVSLSCKVSSSHCVACRYWWPSTLLTFFASACFRKGCQTVFLPCFPSCYCWSFQNVLSTPIFSGSVLMNFYLYPRGLIRVRVSLTWVVYCTEIFTAACNACVEYETRSN